VVGGYFYSTSVLHVWAQKLQANYKYAPGDSPVALLVEEKIISLPQLLRHYATEQVLYLCNGFLSAYSVAGNRRNPANTSNQLIAAQDHHQRWLSLPD
jgi:hypothetical protein